MVVCNLKGTLLKYIQPYLNHALGAVYPSRKLNYNLNKKKGRWKNKYIKKSNVETIQQK